MPGLLLVLTRADGDRFSAAVEVAAAAAALGRPVAVLLKGPALAAELDLLRAMDVELFACQTAMAAAGIPATALASGIEPTGLVALLAARADWHLLLV
jgi:intracellular sulfur oxidation DsrE/DsrF family protein